MSQVSYGTITINDLTDITDVYLEYALVSDTITRAEDIPSSTQWSTTYPTWVSGQQIWIRRVTRKEDIDIPEYGTPYLDKAVSQINNQIQGIDIRTKYMWWNLNLRTNGQSYDGIPWTKPTYPVGTYLAEGKGNSGTFDKEDSSTYGYNAFLTAGGLKLRYNAIDLTAFGIDGINLYSPIVENGVIINNNLGISLTSSNLSFYDPSNLEINKEPELLINSEGIRLSGEKSQFLGNENAYIIFTPDNDETDDFELSSDTTVQTDKIYYSYDGTRYIKVTPEGNENPSSLQWFENVNMSSVLIGGNITLGSNKTLSEVLEEVNTIPRKIDSVEGAIDNTLLSNINLISDQIQLQADQILFSSSSVADNLQSLNNAIEIDTVNSIITIHGLNSDNSIQISSSEITLMDKNNQPVAAYGDEILLGNSTEAHLELSPVFGLGFYTSEKEEEQGIPINRVAYLSSEQLYIENATLKQSLQIGNFKWVVLPHRISLRYNPI